MRAGRPSRWLLSCSYYVHRVETCSPLLNSVRGVQVQRQPGCAPERHWLLRLDRAMEAWGCSRVCTGMSSPTHCKYSSVWSLRDEGMRQLAAAAVAERRPCPAAVGHGSAAMYRTRIPSPRIGPRARMSPSYAASGRGSKVNSGASCIRRPALSAVGEAPSVCLAIQLSPLVGKPRPHPLTYSLLHHRL